MTEKRATGSKVHGWIRAALAWGVAREHLEFNVAEGIGAALPAARKAKKHHAALPYSEVGAALDAIAASSASDAVKACLRFTVLTAVRSGEARGATWNEMDLQGAEWRIPAERMKVAREHRVPLSAAAVETLDRARSLHSPAGSCFPAPARAGVRREAALRGPLHGARLPLLVPRLGERADERAARRRGGGAGAPGGRRGGTLLCSVRPIREAPRSAEPVGGVRDPAGSVTSCATGRLVRSQHLTFIGRTNPALAHRALNGPGAHERRPFPRLSDTVPLEGTGDTRWPVSLTLTDDSTS